MEHWSPLFGKPASGFRLAASLINSDFRRDAWTLPISYTLYLPLKHSALSQMETQLDGHTFNMVNCNINSSFKPWVGIVVYGIRTRTRYSDGHLLKNTKYARRDGQRCLIVKWCSNQPIWSLFIFSTSLKWSGRFYHGNWHIWARRPWLWGSIQQDCKPRALAMWHSQFSSVLCHGLCVLIVFPARLSFQPWKRSPCLNYCFYLSIQGDKITLIFQPELVWRKVKSS